MKNENYKKSILLIVMLFILLFILSGCTSSNNTVNHSQMNNVSKNITTINKTSSNTMTNNTTTNSNISTTSSNTTTALSNSVVSQLKLEPITLKVGKAYVIHADKQTVFNFTKEDWLEFKRLYLDTHKSDNWLTIYFGDKTGIIFTGMSFLGTLCNIDSTDQYAIASPANDLEYIEIYTDTNEVKYDFPESGNTKNYFVGLEK